MMKATLRSAVLLGLLAISLPAFAEVQNVKVSGDITARAFHRQNLDLQDHTCNSATTSTGCAAGTVLDGDNFFMTTTGINVAADLTENVSTFVRVANERDWNLDAAASSTADFAVSQSYVTLKELFYSPLTLRIGKQPIVWGRGFVLGSSLIPGTLGRGGDLHSSITANEFTDFTAFDAIRATLDLSHLGGMGIPLTADYVYIKLNENGVNQTDDVNLQGVNFSTKFDAAHSEIEAYYLNKLDQSSNNLTTPVAGINKTGVVNVWGLRGSAMPVEGLSTWGELAYQNGTRATDATGLVPTGSPFQAWAYDLGAEYTFAHVAMTPKMGAEWIYWSGKDSDGAVSGWDPIARGYFTTAIREFETGQTATGFYNTAQAGDTAAATNQNEISFWGGAKPIEDLNLTSRVNFFWLPVPAKPGTTLVNPEGPRKGYAGTEWDNQVQYNYTDDVQLGFLWGVFWPGSVYHDGAQSTAQELVTTVSVKF